MTLGEILEGRINPERSRKFSTAEFAKSLLRLETLASELGIVDSEKSVHVVGTNGKGSTSWFLSALLDSNESTGLYTSPHLIHFTERVRIGLAPVPEADLLAEYLTLCGEHDLADLTYFELLTVLAGSLFSKRKLKRRVYEAGLGGRLDATRIFRGAHVVLTQIDMDHMNVLGSTPREILQEKLGICTGHARLVISMAQKHFSADEVLEAAPCPVKTFDIPLSEFPTYLEYNEAFARFTAAQIAPAPFPDSLPPMPGRLEKRRVRDKTILFDHAHNPAAIAEVIRSVRRMPGCPDRLLAALGVLVDRNALDCMDAAASPGVRIVLIESEFFQTPIGTGIPVDRLASLLEAEETWILFLGSHRLYSAFLDLSL